MRFRIFFLNRTELVVLHQRASVQNVDNYDTRRTVRGNLYSGHSGTGTIYGSTGVRSPECYHNCHNRELLVVLVNQ